ncbi:hypothetical protein CHS0354_040595 [Potamilus streckersoni]|uniref:CARD domain-containing protein n=1 Tax=Potamilus streckersoni TaxID=2493646 RepID=A0AAE0VWJ7_9BIVA|nr:hypothetical protein CHS0354_040595 [Potamilus streckersoni]
MRFRLGRSSVRPYSVVQVYTMSLIRIGCCALCPRRSKEDESIIITTEGDAPNISCTNAMFDEQLCERRNPEDKQINTDSGYKSDYLNRLSQHDERMIQRNYRFLLENLMATSVTARLVQDGILFPDDEIEIRKGLSHKAKADVLIHKLLHSKPTSFAIFLNVLRETKQEFIALELVKDTKVQEQVPEAWTFGDKIKIERMIQREKSYILDELDPDKILGFFVEWEIFNIEEIFDITFKPRRDKALILLDRVLQKIPFAFNLLLHALKATKSEALADRLSELVSSTRADTTLRSASSNWRRRESIKYDLKDSKIRIQMKTTICLGEDQHPLLQAEASIVDRINIEEWEHVRKKFFKETESVFKKATVGSIIIHLTPFSKRTYTKLLEFCQHSGLEILLKKLLSYDQTKCLVPHGPLTVKVQLLANGVIEEYERSDVAKFRDRIIEEFDTVVDEIDPMNFKKLFIDRRIFSEEYFNQLDQTFAQCRSARATDFVEKILEFGEDAVLAFMETLEMKGPEYLLGVLKKDSTTLVDAHDNNELIAKLEVEKQDSTDSNELLFCETNFLITIHEPDDTNGTQSADSFTGADVDNSRLSKTTFHQSGTTQEPGFAVRVKSFRISSTSDYTSQRSSRFSNDTQSSLLSESDPTMDLEGDLKNEENSLHDC